MTYLITLNQADALHTAASIRDMLNGRGGVALTDDMREQYLAQLDELKDSVPADVARAAWAAVATRDPKTPLSRAMLAWLRGQDLTD